MPHIPHNLTAELLAHYQGKGLSSSADIHDALVEWFDPQSDPMKTIKLAASRSDDVKWMKGLQANSWLVTCPPEVEIAEPIVEFTSITP